MQAVHVCEKYGWTYDEYQSQPQWFLDLIRERMKVDAQRSENEAKRKK